MIAGLLEKTEDQVRTVLTGRFATLLDVVEHYDDFFTLGLGDGDKHDLVEYLKSLPEPAAH